MLGATRRWDGERAGREVKGDPETMSAVVLAGGEWVEQGGFPQRPKREENIISS